MLGGFIKPTHLADFLKQQPSIVNLSTNPSSELSNGTVEVRRNLINNPKLISSNGTTPSNGWGQYANGSTGTLSNVNGVQTITALSLTTNGRRFGLYLPILTVNPAVANDVWHYSVEVTAITGTDFSVAKPQLYVEYYNASNAYLGSTTTNITTTGRVYQRQAPPINTTSLRAYIWFSGITSWTGSAQLSFKEVLYEKLDAMLPYFDGTYNEWQAPDLTPSWTGTPDNSHSILTGVQPADITAAYSNPIWLSTDRPHKGNKFARTLIKTIGLYGVYIYANDTTGAALGTQVTSMITFRHSRGAPVSSLAWTPKSTGGGQGWSGFGTIQTNDWYQAKFTGTPNWADAGAYVRYAAANLQVGDLIDMDEHFVVKGDYKGGWFDGTFNFSDASRNTMDNWRAWLRSQGATGFNTHDLETQWLRGQGYTGTFADMFYAKFGSKDGARTFFKGE
jgi:hypothetical protein